jgi:hypothetical protein
LSVFTGLPGSMLSYSEGFGFDPATDAASLTGEVVGQDLVLAWSPLAGVTAGDAYEVWSSSTRSGFFDGAATLEGTVGVALTTFTDAGVLASDGEHYYWIVPVSAALGRGSFTYSLGVWARTLSGAGSLALPLRPETTRAASWYADHVEGAHGVLWLGFTSWVPHFAAMPAGVYDTLVRQGGGYEIDVARPVLYTFVGR